MMNWDQLLSGVRLRDGQVKDRMDNNPYDLRNDFEDDYARLVFSAAFRRMQDKAQVFPLDNSDFVRTRLTHSLEVSTIGRSLGISVEKSLVRQGRLDLVHLGKISSLLAVSGLVHDLGNPPFGHYGEAAIQKFFHQWFIRHPEEAEKLDKQMRADFENFEGNAQSFRLLNKLQTLRDAYSYNLSAASLASILKYPRSALEGNKSKSERKELELGVSYKKFGYLTAEEQRFQRVVEYTGIGSHRHPVTFLMEAADDIAYSAADLEDGCKKKVIDYHTIVDVFAEALADGTDEELQLLARFTDHYETNRKEKRADALDNAVQQLRIEAQGFMIRSVVEAFLEHHDAILEGAFDQEIISVSKAARVRKAFQEIASILFTNKEILMRELAGGQVIGGLLNMFVQAVTSENRHDPTTEEGKLFELISDNYRFVMERYPSQPVVDATTSLYDRLLLVTDFVCGMTDTYALELYQRLTGIKL